MIVYPPDLFLIEMYRESTWARAAPITRIAGSAIHTAALVNTSLLLFALLAYVGAIAAGESWWAIA